MKLDCGPASAPAVTSVLYYLRIFSPLGSCALNP